MIRATLENGIPKPCSQGYHHPRIDLIKRKRAFGAPASHSHAKRLGTLSRPPFRSRIPGRIAQTHLRVRRVELLSIHKRLRHGTNLEPLGIFLTFSAIFSVTALPTPSFRQMLKSMERIFKANKATGPIGEKNS